MRGQVALKGLGVGGAVNPVEVAGPLRGAQLFVAVIVRLPLSVAVLAHPFPGAAGDGGVLEHVVVGGDDDGIGVGLDLLLPPAEGRAGDNAAGVAAHLAVEVATAEFLRRLVDVAHHQEEEVADAEAVAFPGAVDGVGAARGVDAGERCVVPFRVEPLAPPGVLHGFTGAAAVMVAAEGVDRLTWVVFEGLKLADNLTSFGVVRDMLAARHIAEVEGDIPLPDARLGVAQHIGEALNTVAQVGADMDIAEDPEVEGLAHESFFHIWCSMLEMVSTTLQPTAGSKRAQAKGTPE